MRDKFQILKNFEEAVNEANKDLHEESDECSTVKTLFMGKYGFLFLKGVKYRSQEERQHLQTVLDQNQDFAKLELIKERMLTLYDEPDAKAARAVFLEIGDWIWRAQFQPFMRWFMELDKGRSVVI